MSQSTISIALCLRVTCKNLDRFDRFFFFAALLHVILSLLNCNNSSILELAFLYSLATASYNYAVRNEFFSSLTIPWQKGMIPEKFKVLKMLVQTKLEFTILNSTSSYWKSHAIFSNEKRYRYIIYTIDKFPRWYLELLILSDSNLEPWQWRNVHFD